MPQNGTPTAPPEAISNYAVAIGTTYEVAEQRLRYLFHHDPARFARTVERFNDPPEELLLNDGFTMSSDTDPGL